MPDESQVLKGQRFSRWRGDPEPIGISRPSWATLAIVGAAFYLLFFGTAMLTRHPEHLGLWLPIGLCGLIYGSVFAALIASRRRRATTACLDRDRPADAFRATVVRRSERLLGKSHGTLWFDGAWLRFRGDRFDFRVRRTDLRNRRCPQNPCVLLLALPRGFPKLHATILLHHRTGSGGSERRRFREALGRWWNAPPDAGEPLFPPITYNVERPSSLRLVFDWIPMGIVIALAWFANLPLFPPESLPPRLWLSVPAIAVAFSLILAPEVLGAEWSARRHEQVLRKLA